MDDSAQSIEFDFSQSRVDIDYPPADTMKSNQQLHTSGQFRRSGEMNTSKNNGSMRQSLKDATEMDVESLTSQDFAVSQSGASQLFGATNSMDKT